MIETFAEVHNFSTVMNLLVQNFHDFIATTGFEDEHLSIDESGQLILQLDDDDDDKKEILVLHPYATSGPIGRTHLGGRWQWRRFSLQAITHYQDKRIGVTIGYYWKRRFGYRRLEYYIRVDNDQEKRVLNGYQYYLGWRC